MLLTSSRMCVAQCCCHGHTAALQGVWLTLSSMTVPRVHLVHSWSRELSTNSSRLWSELTRLRTAFRMIVTSWSRLLPLALMRLKASYSLASLCFSALHKTFSQLGCSETTGRLLVLPAALNSAEPCTVLQAMFVSKVLIKKTCLSHAHLHVTPVAICLHFSLLPERLR